MDCDQVAEILDAYTLGASEPHEARGLDEHVSDCIRCWESLSKAQQAVAMLALAAPLESAPEGLEERVMREAAQGAVPSILVPSVILSGFRLGWPTAAGVFGVAGVAALVFAAVVQVQLSDLRTENDDLEAIVAAEEQAVDDMRGIVTVLAIADDITTLPMEAISPEASQATVTYSWSREHQIGFMLCDHLPSIAGGQVFQAWFTIGGNRQSAGTFISDDGSCVLPMELAGATQPTGIGVSIEPEGGSSSPTHEILYTSVDQ